MVYGLLAICLAVVVGFALAEVGTRALAPASGSAGTLDPGLFRYDARLGWRLSPNWSGRHVHEAYSAAYATNRHGFRGTFERARAPGTTRHAFLGDSFTFGFGVDDGHTFVDLLNAGGRGVSYLNFAVPGYSTDQQALLLADTVLDFASESVHVVVYLGNDIFDNQRDIPIQGNARKPRFVNSPGGLALGVPVPRGALPAADAAGALRAIIFGEDASLGPLGSWFGWSALYRRAEPLLHRPSDLDAHFERNFAEALDLFAAPCRREMGRRRPARASGSSSCRGRRSSPGRAPFRHGSRIIYGARSLSVANDSASLSSISPGCCASAMSAHRGVWFSPPRGPPHRGGALRCRR